MWKEGTESAPSTIFNFSSIYHERCNILQHFFRVKLSSECCTFPRLDSFLVVQVFNLQIFTIQRLHQKHGAIQPFFFIRKPKHRTSCSPRWDLYTLIEWTTAINLINLREMTFQMRAQHPICLVNSMERALSGESWIQTFLSHRVSYEGRSNGKFTGSQRVCLKYAFDCKPLIAKTHFHLCIKMDETETGLFVNVNFKTPRNFLLLSISFLSPHELLIFERSWKDGWCTDSGVDHFCMGGWTGGKSFFSIFPPKGATQKKRQGQRYLCMSLLCSLCTSSMSFSPDSSCLELPVDKLV